MRATLAPLEPGERPWPLVLAAALCVILPAANFVLLVSGVRPKIGGHVPSPTSDVLYLGVMLVCAVGMWQKRYWAVLGFMVILLVTILTATLALIRASNLLGFLEPIVVLAVTGFLFLRLVRVLSRLQMPRPPGAT